MRKHPLLIAILVLFPGPLCLAQRIAVTVPATKPLTGCLIPMQENNATWAQRRPPQMVQHMLATAPKGADTTSWQY